MSRNVNPLFKTGALIATGIIIGYALGRGKVQKGVGHTPSVKEEKPLSHYQKLNNLLEAKLKDYLPKIGREFIEIEEVVEESAAIIRIMQFNILARALCEPNAECKITAEICDWKKYRMWRIMEELVQYSSDIICLEEVDTYEELRPYLDSIGYSGVFAPKYASPCLKQKPNYGPDGCAIFYKKSIFKIVNLSIDKIITNGEVNSQVFIIVQLLHLKTNIKMTVVCVHLKSDRNSSQEELRAAQMSEIMKSVKTHVKGNNADFNFTSHQIFFCGDFNGGRAERFNEIIKNDADFLSLVDAYTNELDESKQETFIRYNGPDKPMFKKDLDYVYYNRVPSKLIRVLELPKDDELTNSYGLPNLKYASDHFSLVADFQIN